MFWILEIKWITQLLQNRTGARKPCGTVIDYSIANRPWQHECSLKAKYITITFRNHLKNEHFLLYACFMQNGNYGIPQPSKGIFCIAKIRTSTRDDKSMKSIQFHLALPSFSLSFPLFFQTNLVVRFLPWHTLTQKGSRQLGEPVNPSTSFRGYSNETSILLLLCPTAPIRQYRKQVYKAEDRSLSLSLNQLLFLQ